MDAFQENALQRLFDIKGRPAAKAILVLVADQEMATEVAEISTPLAKHLMSRFWPGPLTLILPARAARPLTAGTGTIGVRQPGHPLARRLCQLYGRPLTGTSANRSGRRPLGTAAMVEQELGELIELILEDGPGGGGLPSTILNIVEEPPRLIREGAIRLEELERYIGKIAKLSVYLPLTLTLSPERGNKRRKFSGRRYIRVSQKIFR